MKTTKKITRTWKTKSGDVKTKVYEYKVRARENKVLVSSSGALYKKTYQKLLKDIATGDSELDQENMYDVEMLIDFYREHGQRLHVNTVKSKLADYKYDKMFLNLGRSPQELAQELNTTVDELRNENNWSKDEQKRDILTINGIRYLFTFTYTGNELMRL